MKNEIDINKILPHIFTKFRFTWNHYCFFISFSLRISGWTSGNVNIFGLFLFAFFPITQKSRLQTDSHWMWIGKSIQYILGHILFSTEKKPPPEIYELNIQLRFPLSLWCMKYVSKRNFPIKTHFLCASNGKSENKLKKRWSERAWRSKGRGVENLRVKTYSSYGFEERKPH